MADIKKIEGYFIKDASARAVAEACVRYDINTQGLTTTQKSNARTNIGAGTSNLALGSTSTTAAAGNHNHNSTYLQLSGGTLTGIVISRSIIPITTNIYDLGTNTSYYASVYTNKIFCTSITSTNNYINIDKSLIPTDDTTYDLGSATNRFNKIYATAFMGQAADSKLLGGEDPEYYATASHNHDSSYLSLSGGTLTGAVISKNIIPITANSYDLGTNTSYYASVYTNKIFCTSITSTNNYINIDKSLIPTDDTTYDLGSATNRFNKIYANTVIAATSISSPAFIETSDINKKNIIGDIDLNKAYDLIDKCSTIIYTLKDDPEQKEQIGTIAQEVQEFFPELVTEQEDGSLTLSYSRLTVIIMKILKDLINRVKKLENN